MRNIFLLTVLLISAYNTTSAQNPILPLFEGAYGDTGAYYKDMDNDLDHYTGTWIYTQGSDTLTITLHKIAQYHHQVYDINFYSDILAGEYKYVKAGVVKVNTLPLLSQNIDSAERNLYGGTIYKKNNFIDNCEECEISERRVGISFRDPERANVLGLRGQFIMRYVIENGIPKIKAKLKETGNVLIEAGAPPGPTSFNLPFGEYVLTKVQ